MGPLYPGQYYTGPDSITQRLLSAPIKLHWAGWEATTYSLQQAGWQLSAQQDMQYGSMRIAMKHEDQQVWGLTDRVDYDYMTALHDPYGHFRNMVIPVRAMANRIMIQLIEPVTAMANFSPIDCTPQLDMRQIKTLEDLAHFAPPLVRTKEIILPEEDVPALLTRILELQKPARDEYFKQQIRAERDGMMIDAHPRQKFHAQILSIAA
jgi:hypothetical protein